MYLGNGTGRCYLSYGWLIICPWALYVSPSPVGKYTARDTADHLGKFLRGVNFKADMPGWVIPEL